MCFYIFLLEMPPGKAPCVFFPFDSDLGGARRDIGAFTPERWCFFVLVFKKKGQQKIARKTFCGRKTPNFFEGKTRLDFFWKVGSEKSENKYTFPETNSSWPKFHGWKMNFLLGFGPIFNGRQYVSFIGANTFSKSLGDNISAYLILDLKSLHPPKFNSSPHEK